MSLRNIYDDKDMRKFDEPQDPYPLDQTQITVNSRVAVCGSTRTGKTTCLYHYLEKSPNTFAKIIVVYKVPEKIYKYMNALLRGNITFIDDILKVPTIEQMRADLEPNQRVLLVIDDWIDQLGNSKVKDKLYNIFLRGAKDNISCWLLCQSYYRIPLEYRQNLTYILLLKMPTKQDIDMILNSFTSDISKDDLRLIYKDAIKKKFDFFKIEVAHCPLNRKFSRNFTDFYEIEDESDA